MTETVTIASLNTQMGRTIREPYGLKPLDGVDVLLLQEVQLEGAELADRVYEETNLTIAAYDFELGLAIAVPASYAITSYYDKILQDRGTIGYKLLDAPERFEKTKFRLRSRGLVAVTLETSDNNAFTVATTHPTVQLKARSRNAQVGAIPEAIADIGGNLVIGADMNHWPRPHQVDLDMYDEAGLRPVEIPGDTFDVSRTRYALLGKLAYVGLGINGQLDAMLYRGMGVKPLFTELIDVPSDHRAVVTRFAIQN